MTFFLLKWVFNAIKLDSDQDDKLLQGQSYVAKSELCKQLKQNNELLAALNCKSTDFEKEVRKLKTAKDGCMTWQEFLDFFFARGIDPLDRLGYDKSDWWFKIDQEGKQIHPKEPTPVKEHQVADQMTYSQKQDRDRE